MRRNLSLSLLLVVAWSLILSGCLSHATVTPPIHHWYSAVVPASLTTVDGGLDSLILWSVVIVGLSVGLFFFLPGQPKIAELAGLSAGSILALSLFIKTTLWLVPWIAAIVVALAGFRIYQKYYATPKPITTIPPTPGLKSIPLNLTGASIALPNNH